MKLAMRLTFDGMMRALRAWRTSSSTIWKMPARVESRKQRGMTRRASPRETGRGTMRSAAELQKAIFAALAATRRCWR